MLLSHSIFNFNFGVSSVLAGLTALVVLLKPVLRASNLAWKASMSAHVVTAITKVVLQAGLHNGSAAHHAVLPSV